MGLATFYNIASLAVNGFAFSFIFGQELDSKFKIYGRKVL
jgi:hypothetical protein